MKMQHFFLDIISFNEPHNTINITNEIISALAEFKIKEKVCICKEGKVFFLILKKRTNISFFLIFLGWQNEKE